MIAEMEAYLHEVNSIRSALDRDLFHLFLRSRDRQTGALRRAWAYGQCILAHIALIRIAKSGRGWWLKLPYRRARITDVFRGKTILSR